MTIKISKLSCLSIFLIALLCSCTTGNGLDLIEEEAQEIVLDENQAITLKVMYFSEEVEPERLRTYSFNLFEKKYPQVELEFIRHNLYQGAGPEEDEEALMKIIDREQPDILQLNESLYTKLAEEGRLTSLNNYMIQDQYDTEGLVPGLLDYIKELGGEQIYGMPYSFFSAVMYYQEDWFDKYNIAYPTDYMTWKELIDLIHQFPTKEKEVNGYAALGINASDDLWEVASIIAETEGINFVNSRVNEMTIHNERWKKVLEMALDIIQSERVNYTNKPLTYDHIFDEDYRYNGGMLIEDREFAKLYLENIPSIQLVTAPVSSLYPDQSNRFKFNDIFAISEDSRNKDAAWKFISYITSDEYSNELVKLKDTYQFNRKTFLVRTSYVKSLIGENRNYEAIYKLKPTHWDSSYWVSESFTAQFNEAAKQVMREVRSGEIKIDEALEYLHQRGEELLALEK